MKFMIEYKIRQDGLTFEQNLRNTQTLLAAFGKWKPEDGLKVHAFVTKVSGAAGYVLVEASDPAPVQTFVTKFNYWNDSDIIPVMDIGDSVPIFQASVEWVKTASAI